MKRENSMSESILLISSSDETGKVLKSISRKLNHKLTIKKNIASGVKVSKDSQIVVIDCNLPDGTCIDCLESLVELNNDLVAIVLVESGNEELTVEAFKKKAFLCVPMPVNMNVMEEVIKKAINYKELLCKSRMLYDCSIEDFLKVKLKGYVQKIKEIGDIDLYDTVVSEVERVLLKIAFEEADCNQVKASQILGLSRNTIRNKLKKYRMI
jgi:Fis family transcriptional regulator